MALVRGACPHDCPDTCAFHVTVEDGRATKLAGRADHPITAGFLCGKVSDYLERVYSPERLLHPLIRTGREGCRRVPAGDLGRGARRRRRPASRGAIERHGPESVLPYSYLGTMGVLQGGAMADRFMDAHRRLEARAHDLRVGRRRRRRHRDRPVARGRSRGVAARAPDRLLGLEPDVDRAAPVAPDHARRAGTARSSSSSTRSAAARRASPTST